MKHRLGITVTSALLLALLFAGTALAGANTVNSKLTAVVGEGTGQVHVTANPKDHGTFVGEVTVNVHGTSPNTEFSLQRALDPVPNGICDQLGPFEEQGTFTTSPGGAGALHVERHTPAPSGSTLDLLERVVGADGTVLVSDCMTITLK